MRVAGLGDSGNILRRATGRKASMRAGEEQAGIYACKWPIEEPDGIYYGGRPEGGRVASTYTPRGLCGVEKEDIYATGRVFDCSDVQM